MRTLYEITQELRELLDKAQEIDLDETALKDTIESMGLDADLNNKVEGYWYVIDELEASNKRIQTEIDRLSARKKTQQDNVKRMKESLTGTLDYLGIDKIKTDRSTIWIQNNPIGLDIVDESRIPKEFYVTPTPQLSKREVLDYIKEHGEQSVAGVRLKQTRGIRRR